MRPDDLRPDHTTRGSRVLFLAGTGRSGSTMLSNLLGSTAGLTSVGELRYLWERGLAEGAPCGCGAALTECPFWQPVLSAAYPTGTPDPAAVVALDHDLLRLRNLPRLARAARRGDDPEIAAYGAHLRTVLAALADHTGGDIVIDSSKLVGYGVVLRYLTGLDVTVVHLVRDPRGAAWSWSRLRARADRGAGADAMGREGALKNAVLWQFSNAAIARLLGGDRYLRVRYEDFAADPATALAPILGRLGLDPADLPVGPAGQVHIATVHSVAGNPVRMASGTIAITPDGEWQRAMPARARALVTAVTAPGLLGYGYPLRSPRPPVFLEDLRGPRRAVALVRRNLTWIREQGLARALEEKEIDPVRTVPAAVGKARYRRRREPGGARPVYVVGLQRSGTNMLVRGLGTAPEVEVHNENDRRAFLRYKLRDDAVLESIIARSRHSHVLFKPLCDSHRTDHLLDKVASTTPGRAVWIYRDVDGRVRSALAKFGDGNLRVLREFTAGLNTTRWHVQRISAESAALVRSFDYDTMTPESAAALMWVIRNRLFFETGLADRPDVHLVSYNDFTADPEPTMRRLCAFLDFPYAPALVRHVAARPPTYRAPLAIDPRIREQSDLLTEQLTAVACRTIRS